MRCQEREAQHHKGNAVQLVKAWEEFYYESWGKGLE